MRWLLFLILAALVRFPAPGQDLSKGPALNLSDLVREALRNNPEIRASRHEVDVTRAKVRQAGALDDPELMYMQEGFPGL